jgi:hypothetical protein
VTDLWKSSKRGSRSRIQVSDYPPNELAGEMQAETGEQFLKQAGANIPESFTATVFVNARLYIEGQFTPISKPFKLAGFA